MECNYLYPERKYSDVLKLINEKDCVYMLWDTKGTPIEKKIVLRNRHGTTIYYKC